VLAYSPGLGGPLLFDDVPALTNNSVVKIGGTQFDEWRTAAFSSRSGPLGRPVAMLTFAANHVVFEGFSPATLKAINLFIHLLTGALIYCFCLAVLSSPATREYSPERIRLAAAIAACLWLLHPLHVSTVLYAVQRMAQMATFFILLGLLVYARYRLRWAEAGATTGEIIAAALWLALITMLAALSKENGLLLPLLIAVVEVCCFRGRWSGGVSRVVGLLPWLALGSLAVLTLYLILFPPEFIASTYRGRDFSLEERVMTQSRLLWQYLGWLVYPDIRAMGFQHDDIPLSRSLFEPATTVLSIAAWVAALGAALHYRQRYPLFLFALLFYLVGHAMESGIWPLEMVYEHRNYLPSVGPAVLLAAVLSRPAPFFARVRPGVVTGCVFLALFTLLGLRSMSWSSQLSMAYTNVVNHPDSPRANFFYGSALVERHRELQSEGGSESELRDLMVGARGHFLHMQQRDPLDLSAPVMLQMIESTFFPGLEDRGDEISRVLESRVMQSSDRAAFRALVDCGIKTGCGLEQDHFFGFFAALSERYPTGVGPTLEQYRYMRGLGITPERRVAILEDILRVSPENESAIYYLLEEAHERGDYGSIYQLIFRWMQIDARRQRLPLIKALFEGGAS
jgi:hypothetical protein